MGYNIWVVNYGNRTDKLGKMVWSEFSAKALHKTILGIGDWDRIPLSYFLTLISIFKRKFILRTEFIFA